MPKKTAAKKVASKATKKAPAKKPVKKVAKKAPAKKAVAKKVPAKIAVHESSEWNENWWWPLAAVEVAHTDVPQSLK